MQTTLPKLADPSRFFFETRGFSSNTGFGRQLSSHSQSAEFSSLLSEMRDRRHGSVLSQSREYQEIDAQESTGDAQALPNDDDADVDVEASSRDGEHIHPEAPNESGNIGALPAEVESPEVADDEDQMIAQEPADESVPGGPVEEDADDASPRPPSSSGLGTPVTHSHGSERGDEEFGVRSEKKRGNARLQERLNTPDRDRGESTSIRRDDARTAPQAVSTTASQSDHAKPEHHHGRLIVEQLPLNREASVADEPSPPPHLQKATQPRSEQNAERRDPIAVDQRDSRVMPAASRVQQVESQVRLENATSQTGASDIASRIALTPQTGTNGSSLNGEQNGQNLPGQGPSSTERATLDDARFSGRVIRGLTAMINQRGGTMTMRLDPPDLGQLRVQMTIARGTVSASFVAQTQQARALLEKNMAALRTALESHGLTVDRLNVQSSQSSSQQGHLMNDDSTQRQQDQQRQDAAGGESRGRRDERDEVHDRRRPDDFADVIEQLERTQHIRH
jgi:flagellar hook-length control protein FliK